MITFLITYLIVFISLYFFFKKIIGIDLNKRYFLEFINLNTILLSFFIYVIYLIIITKEYEFYKNRTIYETETKLIENQNEIKDFLKNNEDNYYVKIEKKSHKESYIKTISCKNNYEFNILLGLHLENDVCKGIYNKNKNTYEQYEINIGDNFVKKNIVN